MEVPCESECDESFGAADGILLNVGIVSLVSAGNVFDFFIDGSLVIVSKNICVSQKYAFQ